MGKTVTGRKEGWDSSEGVGTLRIRTEIVDFATPRESGQDKAS